MKRRSRRRKLNPLGRTLTEVGIIIIVIVIVFVNIVIVIVFEIDKPYLAVSVYHDFVSNPTQLAKVKNRSGRLGRAMDWLRHGGWHNLLPRRGEEPTEFMRIKRSARSSDCPQ